MATRKQATIALIAAGLAGSAIPVSAQPVQVNGSGATLQQAFFRAPAATNDFIDVDGDGITGEQLAPNPADLTPPFAPSNVWHFSYRVVGSVNGFSELRDWGLLFATAPDFDAANLTLNSDFSDESLYNRSAYVNAGAAIIAGGYNAANPGGFPLRADFVTRQVTTSTDPAVAGIGIDFAALDVPVSWATLQEVGTPILNRVPAAPGYGNNPRLAVGKDGTVLTQDNKLASLISPNGVTLNTNTASPDANTVYDVLFALAPVAAPVNYGVGMSQIEMSDLRHLSATGRRINGENLMKITRDSGSGTRNAFMNGICLDPSWGVGENIGDRTVSSANDRLGPDFQPSNKGGSSRVDNTTQNHRLAIGHTGAERGESSGWLINGRMDVLAVRADLKGGTVFARPNLTNVLDSGPDGYNIVGPATISTIGDPRSNSAAAGGWGWLASEVGPYPLPSAPMANEDAAAFVNNITRSVAAFVSVPGGDPTLFSPGEFLATQFLLVAAADNVLESNPDASEPCVPIIPNPDLNLNLQNFIANFSGNVLGLPEFQTFNVNNSRGTFPDRTSGTYSDGAPSGFHRTQGGSLFADNDLIPNTGHSWIAGDFNDDGLRNLNDAGEMVEAYIDRTGGAAWTPVGGDVSIEVIGDFNGDGNFTIEDLRYWGDGLAIDPVSGNLDRFAGFEALDLAFGGNLFGVTLATGSSPAPGAAAADIAGSATKGPTRGFVPNAFDGVVDAQDIDYIVAQFVGDANAEIDWTDTFEAVNADLSADVNGDLLINKDDVEFTVVTILGTAIGDVNLDGAVDGTDLSIAQNNIGGSGWASGDVNCDGIVDQADVDFIDAIVNPGGCGPADTTTTGTSNGIPDGVVDISDYSFYLTLWGAGNLAADVTTTGTSNGIPDGVVDISDFSFYLTLWGAGCP